jgi:acetolactate synthase-1/2/3 large subunit
VTSRAESTGEALLELLANRGVEYFLAGGSGTDFPPIIEGYAKRQAAGQPVPRPITVAHEITTAARAHGYAMVAGRPLFAMVHTIVGTANTVGGIINAARVRAPVVLAAGRTANSERGEHVSRVAGIHWAQESFDQAGMIREYVKWDFELRTPSDLEKAVDRAFAIARSAPAGPVYLSLPLDTLAAPPPPAFSSTARIVPASSAVADKDSIARAASALVRARNPLVIATSLGRDPEAVQPLVELADLLGLPVVEHWHTHLNFPQDNPLHIGYDSTQFVENADVILVAESDAPWFPALAEPPEAAVIVQVDEEPLHQQLPMRGFPTDITLTGSAAASLTSLAHAVRDLEPDDSAIGERKARWSAVHRQQRESWAKTAQDGGRGQPVSPAWVSRCVANVLEPDDIAITEYVLDPMQTSFNRPGTYFNHSHAGGLGWAPGAALGAKLARPDATVVCCVGDGCYNFGAPLATHYTAQSNNLPVLFVVYNNSAWGKTYQAVKAYAPDGYAARMKVPPLCDLGESPRYDQVCKAAGGYGERVTDPAELPAALERALHVVRSEGRQALLDVVTDID